MGIGSRKITDVEKGRRAEFLVLLIEENLKVS